LKHRPKAVVSPEVQALAARMGPDALEKRLTLQAEHAADVFMRRANLFHIENVQWFNVLVYHILRLTRTYERGYRNYHDIRIVHNAFVLPSLPQAFDGYVILQLSDLHIDLDFRFVDSVIERLEDLRYDLCVLTGDYRANTSGRIDHTTSLMQRLAGHLRPPVLAILGNHDFIEQVPPLERCGVRFLLNENVPLTRNGATIHVAGCDDPHFYMTDNLWRARAGLGHDCVTILLAHSPEIWREAEAHGFDVMLCGHTHGGQICLPGGVAILSNGKCPRRFIRGPWRYGRMQGYTSAGTGACAVPARFNCPPEITLHTLRRGSQDAGEGTREDRPIR
jgi:predicted MPP superfamily phosphohydrolase